MSKRTFRIREGEHPLLDIASYGRGGPGKPSGRFTPAQLSRSSGLSGGRRKRS
jgi:hypothetical protein